MPKRKPGDYITLMLRGMAMGGADVIPGVSGGTIAFITGIYEELIQSIKSVNATFFKILFTRGIAAAWQHINGSFLLALVTGILISIFSLARLMSWLLANHPMTVWAFFFGLIAGSAIYIGRKVDTWSWLPVLFLLAGTATAYYITIASPAATPETYWFVFLSGAIAFCALVLPGISGAFILVLLSKYEFMLNAIRDLQVSMIAVFAAGGVIGVIAFSNVIAWLFKKYHNATLAVLAGFMTGSLNKLWPWKKVLETRANSHGDEVPFLEKSISPARYAEIFSSDPRYFEFYGHQPQLVTIIASALAGLALIVVFMLWDKKQPGLSK
jgi:putative membrane protein